MLLLLPLFYVGSYLALLSKGSDGSLGYRMNADLCQRVYWPLETLDRQWRPTAWPVWVIIDDFGEATAPKVDLFSNLEKPDE